MDILLRKDAVKAGLKRYFNGVPCPRGHIAERLVKGGCLVCDREDSLARNRRNSEKLAEYARMRRTEDPERFKAEVKAYRAANPERAKAWKAASQKRNRTAANARNKKWADANRVTINARIAEWAKANPEKCLERSRRRQASKLNRIPAWSDRNAVCLIYRTAQLAKVTWPELYPEVDHVIPLQGDTVSGLHVHRNLQILPRTENRSKSNHF